MLETSAPAQTSGRWTGRLERAVFDEIVKRAVAREVIEDGFASSPLSRSQRAKRGVFLAECDDAHADGHRADGFARRDDLVLVDGRFAVRDEHDLRASEVRILFTRDADPLERREQRAFDVRRAGAQGAEDLFDGEERLPLVLDHGERVELVGEVTVVERRFDPPVHVREARGEGRELGDENGVAHARACAEHRGGAVENVKPHLSGENGAFRPLDLVGEIAPGEQTAGSERQQHEAEDRR